MARRGTWGQRLADLLVDHWYRQRPSALSQALRPLSWLYDALRRVHRWRQRQLPIEPLRVPVVVVGNLIVGGAGKTPSVIAIVQLLQARGWHPAVVSRGHGRRGLGLRPVLADSPVSDVGDEPALIHSRTGVPCWVGRDRVAAAQALLAAHPEVDVLVADDGLQHHTLARTVGVVVFDERGVGNGLLLPAGPLREPLPPSNLPDTLVLYNAAHQSTKLPGHLLDRQLRHVWPLAEWLGHQGRQARPAGAAADIGSLRSRPLVAVAGIAAPERFFGALEAVGLTITRCPLPDHFDFSTPPWADDTPDVIITEKDAIKLDPASIGAVRVWVAGLDFGLPPAWVRQLLHRLGHRNLT